MIEVHVWESAWLRYLPGGGEGSPGHASISIDDVYVSFWPGDDQGKLQWGGYGLHTLQEDLAAYQGSGQGHWSAVIPPQEAGSPGLDKSQMLARWNEIVSSNPSYSATLQCSGVVNQLLLAGGSQRFAPTRITSWSTWYLLAVSPADIKSYVQVLIPAIEGSR